MRIAPTLATESGWNGVSSRQLTVVGGEMLQARYWTRGTAAVEG
jgi:hypothetical protein